jgi:hypothetical protein
MFHSAAHLHQLPDSGAGVLEACDVLEGVGAAYALAARERSRVEDTPVVVEHSVPVEREEKRSRGSSFRGK